MDKKIEMIKEYRKENIFDYPRFLIFRDTTMVMLLVLLVLLNSWLIQKSLNNEALAGEWSVCIIAGSVLISIMAYVMMYNLKRLWLYVTDVANYASLIDGQMQKLDYSNQKTMEYCKDLNRLYTYILNMSRTNTHMIFRNSICGSEEVFGSFFKVLNLDVKEYAEDTETIRVIERENLHTVGDLIFLYNDLEWPDDNLKGKIRCLHPILDEYFDSGDFLKNILISRPYRQYE